VETDLRDKQGVKVVDDEIPPVVDAAPNTPLPRPAISTPGSETGGPVDAPLSNVEAINPASKERKE